MFEIELVKQVEINVDYILELVKRYLSTKGSGEDKEILATIDRAINSSPSLRNKKDLIEQFVASVSSKSKVNVQWQEFLAGRKTEELDALIASEGLKPDETRVFIDNAFRDGALPVTGVGITRIIPAVSRFSKSGEHAARKQGLVEKLMAFFDRYQGLV